MFLDLFLQDRLIPRMSAKAVLFALPLTILDEYYFDSRDDMCRSGVSYIEAHCRLLGDLSRNSRSLVANASGR